MKYTEIILRNGQPLQFDGERIGTVQVQETADRIDGLTVHFDNGPHVELRAVVDVSEQLECPRVFVIEGALPDAFLLIGGEKAYEIATDGTVRSEASLFRKWGEEEYWTTRIIEHASGVIVIYEAGVMAIGEDLALRWHTPKFFNDVKGSVNGIVVFSLPLLSLIE
jgi:hypothetical protein